MDKKQNRRRPYSMMKSGRAPFRWPAASRRGGHVFEQLPPEAAALLDTDAPYPLGFGFKVPQELSGMGGRVTALEPIVLPNLPVGTRPGVQTHIVQ